MKYKGRKKYTYEEACQMLEVTMQMWATNQECINYWKRMPRSRSDILIEVLTNTTREEAIEQVSKQQEYLISKMDYLRKFAPLYKIKGSFGLAY